MNFEIYCDGTSAYGIRETDLELDPEYPRQQTVFPAFAAARKALAERFDEQARDARWAATLVRKMRRSDVEAS